MSRARLSLFALVCATTLFVGCASSSNDESASIGTGVDGVGAEDRPFSGGDEVATAGGEEGDSETTEGSESSGIAFEGAVLVDSGRKVISTASLTVEVDDVGAASQRAVVMAEAAGGFVFAQSSRYEGDVSSTVTLKLPPGEFQSTLLQLSELGTPVRQDLATEDVTGRAIDLESRIHTAEASISRLRTYLEGAGSVGDLTQLEGELLVRETDLETLEGQQRALEGQIDFATVVVTFAEEGEAPIEDDDDELPGFFDGLDGGITAATTTGTITLAFVGAVVPFLPVLLLIALVVWINRRRSRRLGVQESAEEAAGT